MPQPHRQDGYIDKGILDSNVKPLQFNLQRESYGIQSLGGAFVLGGRGLTGSQALSSTISKDKTRGEQVRNGLLLAEFGQKKNPFESWADTKSERASQRGKATKSMPNVSKQGNSNGSSTGNKQTEKRYPRDESQVDQANIEPDDVSSDKTPRGTTSRSCASSYVSILTYAGPNPTKVRTWRDVSGSFSVEAEFLALEKGKIHMHKVNGVKIAVPMENISIEDLEYVGRVTGVSISPNPQEKEEITEEIKKIKMKTTRKIYFYGMF